MRQTSPMIRFELFFGLMVLALCVYGLLDVIGRSDGEIRNLPKIWWIVLVLLFPFVGSIAYLAAGRPQSAARRSPHERAAPQFPEYDRPGRAAATNPEADEEFLRKVRERAEEQRRAYQEKLRKEQRDQQPNQDKG